MHLAMHVVSITIDMYVLKLQLLEAMTIRRELTTKVYRALLAAGTFLNKGVALSPFRQVP